ELWLVIDVQLNSLNISNIQVAFKKTIIDNLSKLIKNQWILMIGGCTLSPINLKCIASSYLPREERQHYNMNFHKLYTYYLRCICAKSLSDFCGLKPFYMPDDLPGSRFLFKKRGTSSVLLTVEDFLL
ncbi:hypothetical protein L9F63_026071, partial [Diploptera punctata]